MMLVSSNSNGDSIDRINNSPFLPHPSRRVRQLHFSNRAELKAHGMATEGKHQPAVDESRRQSRTRVTRKSFDCANLECVHTFHLAALTLNSEVLPWL